MDEHGNVEGGFRRVTWRSRDIGYGVEEGATVGEWGAMDWIGKRELAGWAGGANETVYLFPDEVLTDEPVDEEREPEGPSAAPVAKECREVAAAPSMMPSWRIAAALEAAASMLEAL